jgi:hypothetical protein
MLGLEAASAAGRRVKGCIANHAEILHEVIQQAESPEIDCVKPEVPSDRIYMCVLKRAETKLTSAEALLLKH